LPNVLNAARQERQIQQSGLHSGFRENTGRIREIQKDEQEQGTGDDPLGAAPELIR